MKEVTWVLLHQNIKNEVSLLQRRLTVLTLFDHLLDIDPPFFDDETCEIVEPYASFIQLHLPLLDGETFIRELEGVWMQCTAVEETDEGTH